jgi:diadenosine tetraphosphate (Ap4A) HIT family hydrolase
MTANTCPFCTIVPSLIILANGHSVAIHDGFPVSPGHMLIIPRRHIGSLFEATAEERMAMLDLLAEARELLLNGQITGASPRSSHGGGQRKPDGFNIGINDGTAAGQTVPHLHIHIIPRYSGDMLDPRGGVRWIFPERAIYWGNGP